MILEKLKYNDKRSDFNSLNLSKINYLSEMENERNVKNKPNSKKTSEFEDNYNSLRNISFEHATKREGCDCNCNIY